eukprot:7377891-Prymnesium_polylepis.2
MGGMGPPHGDPSRKTRHPSRKTRHPRAKSSRAISGRTPRAHLCRSTAPLPSEECAMRNVGASSCSSAAYSLRHSRLSASSSSCPGHVLSCTPVSRRKAATRTYDACRGATALGRQRVGRSNGAAHVRAPYTPSSSSGTCVRTGRRLLGGSRGWRPPRSRTSRSTGNVGRWARGTPGPAAARAGTARARVAACGSRNSRGRRWPR